MSKQLHLIIVALLFALAAAPLAAQLRTESEAGPVKVVVELDREKVQLSDEPVLTVTISSEIGVRVERPPFGESVGGFVVRGFREPLPTIESGREVVRQIYTLEPTQTGKLTIRPFTIRFVDSRPGRDSKTNELKTEPLTVEVESMFGDRVPSLEDLQPLVGPLEIEEPSDRSVYGWIGLALLLLAAITVALLKWNHRRAFIEAKQLTPSELAKLELEKLHQSDLVHRDIKLFYVELTAIVRRFIERTTGIQAPEQTTEEFLREIGGSKSFDSEFRSKLGDFLEAADLVKFAAFEPKPEDVDDSLQKATAFVERPYAESTQEAS